MLKLTGNVGKSIVVDALDNYRNARVYSYNRELIFQTESYHVNSDECSVKEFCDFVYNDINELGTERLPVNIVAIYTNLTNEDDIKLLEECAHKLEEEAMVRIVLVASKI